MTSTMRAAVGIAIVAVVAAGALAFSTLRSGVGGPSPAPSATPVSTADATPPVGPFSFTSPLYGYTVTVPTGWTVTPSTAAWQSLAQPAYDLFKAPASQGDEYDDVGIEAQPIPAGTTADSWLVAYAESQANSSRTCKGPAADWTDATVGWLAIRRLDLRCTGDGYDLRYLDVAFVIDGTGYAMTGNPTVIGQFLEEFESSAPGATAGAAGVTASTTYTSASFGITLSYPADWSGTAPADDREYVVGFVSPGATDTQIRLDVWRKHIDIFGGTSDLTSVVGKYCSFYVTPSCETFAQQALALDFANGGQGGCALLVPTPTQQYAFLSFVDSCAITESTSSITVVVIDREDEFPPAARYGGSVELLESIVATMKVWQP